MAFKDKLLPKSIKNPIRLPAGKDKLEVDKWDVNNTLKRQTPLRRQKLLVISDVNSKVDLERYQNLIKSISMNFCRRCEVEYICFADKQFVKEDYYLFNSLYKDFGIDGVISVVLVENKKEWIRVIRNTERRYDFLFYISPYLEVISEVRFDDIHEPGKYMFANHSWYYDGIGEPCRYYKSKAYITEKANKFHYVCPWIFGAEQSLFHNILEKCIEMEEDDLRCKIKLDLGFESYLNKFAFDNRLDSVFIGEEYNGVKEITPNIKIRYCVDDIPEYVKDLFKNTRGIITVEARVLEGKRLNKIEEREENRRKRELEANPPKKKTLDEELAELESMTYQDLLSDKWKIYDGKY